MLTPEQVKTLITAELDCTHVDVEGDGHHFFAVIVSPPLRASA
jgi:acid stress-induced BolA-like protein IbaG/YrbA